MPPSGKGKAKEKVPKWDVPTVMKPINKLKQKMEKTGTAKKKTLDDIGMSGVTKEVVAMDTRGVMSEIERIAIQATLSIMRGQGFQYMMPARTSSNMIYVEELDRLVLKDKMLTRVFADASSARKTAITTRVLQIILELCAKGIHVTKRDLFYTDVKLFKQQTESDDVLDDAACMIGCTRSSLNVVASEKGIVVGKIIFDEFAEMVREELRLGKKKLPEAGPSRRRPLHATHLRATKLRATSHELQSHESRATSCRRSSSRLGPRSTTTRPASSRRRNSAPS